MKWNENYVIKLILAFSLLIIYMQGFSQESTQKNNITNLIGTVEIRAVSYQNSEAIQYLLIKDDHTMYSMRFVDFIPNFIRSGVKIMLKHATLQTVNTRNELLLSGKDVILVQDVNFKAIPTSFGPQRTIVFLINFQNQPNNKPFTHDQVRNMFFTQLSNMYYESSYRQTTVVGNVIGWYTLPLSSTQDCNVIANAIPQLAENAARNAGVDLSSYKRRVYLFPGIPNCGWAGVATIQANGAYSNAWINGQNDLSLIGHEVGHNLGLYHSRLLLCAGSPNQGQCRRDEYGDRADIMGIEGTAHFNAFQKDRLGWLNNPGSPPIRTVTTSGTYTIDTYETANANVKALKVLKRNLTNGSKDYYYLEFRRNIGYDVGIGSCSDCDFTKGILIHQGNSMNADSSDLLDMTPSDNQTKRVALLPGRSFTDASAPNGGVTFRLNSIGNTASVQVTFGDTTPPPSGTVYSYKVAVGYPFTRVTINNNFLCPDASGNSVCLVANQSVDTNIVIKGSNNHFAL